MSEKLTEGWVTLLNSTKYHYVRNGRSLCGKWMYLGSDYTKDEGGHNPKDCAACKKKLHPKNKHENS